jgi:hypothetical protein
LIDELNRRFYHDMHRSQEPDERFYCLKSNDFLGFPDRRGGNSRGPGLAGETPVPPPPTNKFLMVESTGWMPAE